MRWKKRSASGLFSLRESVDIRADVERVFSSWNRYEDFPRFMAQVRRTKRIAEDRILWDVDIAGRQVVWEARIVESIDGKRVRWESTWGTANAGEVHFEPIASAPDTSSARPARSPATRLSVEIRFRPKGFLENLAARVGSVDRRVRDDLARFARHVERLSHSRTAQRAR